MLKVLRHGNSITVKNPITLQESHMINVVFTEEGRSGADATMSATNNFLDKIVGETTGLGQTRVHTQPVLASTIDKFPVGKEIEGHINRELFSTPQIRQHMGVAPRMVSGRPTYFKTWLSDEALPDVDFRLDNDVIADKNPDLIFSAKVGAAEVQVTERRGPQNTGRPILTDVDLAAH